mmetsp:Transcript_72889/g.101356  ORF Transcript_72889/g.101356 Transcript_72889/m.101356 type:complete len:80 (-) Transcript_72889:732-971(-)
MLGAAIKGSSSIHPQMHHTNELIMFAVTSGTGIELLSRVRITRGRLTKMEIAPMKLQNEEIKPVRNKARSIGSTASEQS